MMGRVKIREMRESYGSGEMEVDGREMERMKERWVGWLERTNEKEGEVIPNRRAPCFVKPFPDAVTQVKIGSSVFLHSSVCCQLSRSQFSSRWAFSSWFFRFGSSASSSWKKHFNSSIFRSSSLHQRARNPLISTNLLKPKEQQRLPSWPISFFPLAVVAVSAGTLALDLKRNPSLCDSSLDYSNAAKDTTEVVVQGAHKEVSQELIDELKDICKGSMTLDYEERYFHGNPQNSFHKAVNIPDVVVFPRSQEEVSKIVISCNKHKVPIVPYGGATSIEGHTLTCSWWCVFNIDSSSVLSLVIHVLLEFVRVMKLRLYHF
ncbi:D-lactate dehydrogenase cytochrome, mitochondrial isoform X2 [Cinnamomum micranthum f. kanehirae]|uniref:D-lactate dehydrogenase cytochrome, mitochondrial isoform X2 n=1 Tax=Cinnamomum micranthum f. kanehirae TaxID=337451 RepID=A0A443NPA2_9MAGN|nr:D-lactate dehydrogenase cytochrome, mitochondrial isoform X2 [Cinnamomum micranthum f. kanehirae]